MTVIKQLLGHDTPETAFMVLNYPWGFRMKTKRRYWIETTKRGQRAIYQTMDPRTERWCKPKKGTYSDIMFMYLNEEEHVKFDGITRGGYEERLKAFLEKSGCEHRRDDVLKVLLIPTEFPERFSSAI